MPRCAKMPLAFNNGEVDYKMNWYYGPTDYKLLKTYDRNIEEIVPLGWGIFGWINKFIFAAKQEKHASNTDP